MPKTLLVARLVAFTFHDEDINNHNLTVNHIDGNRLNNDIKNLELIPLGDNVRHAFNIGLMPYKTVELINKKDNSIKIFRSMAEASKFMNFNKGYLSSKFKKGIYENNSFKWKLINGLILKNSIPNFKIKLKLDKLLS